MELKHRPCPLCDSTDPSQLFMESNYAEEKMDGFSYLESVLPLLKPGGAFVTVSHNFRSLSARLMGDKSPIYDIEHLQLFSLNSMAKLLGQCGYTEISARPVANTYPLHYWLKMLPVGTALKKRLIGYSKLAKLGYWPIPLRAGNMFAIAYKK